MRSITNIFFGFSCPLFNCPPLNRCFSSFLTFSLLKIGVFMKNNFFWFDCCVDIWHVSGDSETKFGFFNIHMTSWVWLAKVFLFSQSLCSVSSLKDHTIVMPHNIDSPCIKHLVFCKFTQNRKSIYQSSFDRDQQVPDKYQLMSLKIS